MKKIIIVVAIFLLLWILWILFADRNLESPQYTLVEIKSGYEIREYESYIVAETSMKKDSERSAFGELGGYIFGANISGKNIAMTAPLALEQEGEVIAMTAPVSTQEKDEIMTMSFMMPSEFTLENLPRPKSVKVYFREVPPGTFAVLSFSGLASNKKYRTKTQQLQQLLQRDGVVAISDSQLLQYDRPTKFPLLRKNEIKIQIQESS